MYILIYYLAVGLFTAGETFAVLVIEKANVKWYNWIGVVLIVPLWLPLLIYGLLCDKYRRG